jgi:hypothetical protein
MNSLTIDTSKNSTDDLTELCKVGVISWPDVVRMKIEQILGIKLLEDVGFFFPLLSSNIRRYRIPDLITGCLSSVLLYVVVDIDNCKEPTSFCFRNFQGTSIPLSGHTPDERRQIRDVRYRHQFFPTPIEKLTREAHLSAC